MPKTSKKPVRPSVVSDYQGLLCREGVTEKNEPVFHFNGGEMGRSLPKWRTISSPPSLAMNVHEFINEYKKTFQSVSRRSGKLSPKPCGFTVRLSSITRLRSMSNFTSMQVPSLRLNELTQAFVVDVSIHPTPNTEPRELKLSKDVREYCDREVLLNELWMAIDLAQKHFKASSDPTILLEQDPELDDYYLVLEFNVTGSTKEIAASHKAVAFEWAKAVPWPKSGKIRFTYDII